NERGLRVLHAGPGPSPQGDGGSGHGGAREGEAARAGQGLDPRGTRNRVLPHPALGRGRGRVPRRPRALAGERLRPLRARPVPGEAGTPRRGARPLQARPLSPSPEPHVRAARPRLKAVVRRVALARVLVGDEVVAEIDAGLCVLLAVARGDDLAAADRLAAKIARLRIFENDEGRFDRSVLDTGGEALVVSEFTLIADTAKGNRPSFGEAARPDEAEPLYEAFVEALRGLGVAVTTGSFGARMAVELVNDGPVTIVLE